MLSDLGNEFKSFLGTCLSVSSGISCLLNAAYTLRQIGPRLCAWWGSGERGKENLSKRLSPG